MESIGQNTKLFNLPENKIFFSLEILLLKELPLIDDQKQQNDDGQRQFQIRTISLENFIYCAHVDGQEDEIEEVHPIGCRCRANDKNDPVQRKYIRFFVIIKDLEKAIDDEDNSESTQIFVPLEWKSCAKSFAFVEFIGRQIFGHIYKCIKITVPRSADIDSGIEILALLNELFEHINTVNKLVNYNFEDGTAAAEENEYGCNSEYLGIHFSNCKQKAAQELELLGKMLAKNYVINLDKWPIADNSRFGYGNGMKKKLEILYSSMDPPELLIDACFKAPIKFKSFRFLYCISNLSKFVEKLIEYFLYEKAETIMPESVIIEQFDPQILADWPPQCLAICDEQLSSAAAENMERKNQIQRKEGITLAVKCEYLQYSLLPSAKFILCNESMKKEFIMNIWFRSKDWTINPETIYIYQTNPINTNINTN